jgi:hypothetical protein
MLSEDFVEKNVVEVKNLEAAAPYFEPTESNKL